MSFTITAAAGNHLNATGANTLSIAANAGQLIAVACFARGATNAPGSIADSGGNTYLRGNALSSDGGSDQQDTFYILSATNAVTTITYTPGAVGNQSAIAAWVLTPTSAASFADSS